MADGEITVTVRLDGGELRRAMREVDDSKVLSLKEMVQELIDLIEGTDTDYDGCDHEYYHSQVPVNDVSIIRARLAEISNG